MSKKWLGQTNNGHGRTLYGEEALARLEGLNKSLRREIDVIREERTMLLEELSKRYEYRYKVGDKFNGFVFDGNGYSHCCRKLYGELTVVGRSLKLSGELFTEEYEVVMGEDNKVHKYVVEVENE